MAFGSTSFHSNPPTHAALQAIGPAPLFLLSEGSAIEAVTADLILAVTFLRAAAHPT